MPSNIELTSDGALFAIKNQNQPTHLLQGNFESLRLGSNQHPKNQRGEDGLHIVIRNLGFGFPSISSGLKSRKIESCV